MAIVEGVGYPNPNLSHFAAMDIWQTLDLSGQGSQGWLGKYVAGLVDKDGHPFQSMAVGIALPTALQALNADVPVVADPASYTLKPDPEQPQKRPTGARRGADEALQHLSALGALRRPARRHGPERLERRAAVARRDLALYAAGHAYPTSNLSKGLQVLAEVIVEGLGLRVGYVTLGGFDTHGEQANTQARPTQRPRGWPDGLLR